MTLSRRSMIGWSVARVGVSTPRPKRSAAAASQPAVAFSASEIDLLPPDGISATGAGEAVDVSESGLAVGTVTTVEDETLPVLWTSDGVGALLPCSGDGGHCRPWIIAGEDHAAGTATRRRVYGAPAAACAACALRERCTTSRRGRRVGRSLEQAHLERVRGYHATEPYAEAMCKRKVWVEPLVAEANAWRGLRRFRLRGAERVNTGALLIAAGQNLERLLSARGWGRRPWPGGAAGLAMPALASAAMAPG